MIIQFLISYLLSHTPIYQGSDLRDLAIYRNDQTALNILEDITAHPSKYLPDNVYLLSGFPDRKHQENTVFNIEFANNILSITYLHNKMLYIRQIEMDDFLYPISVHDYSLSDITWTVNISLIDRKMILSSDLYGIKKVYPIGSSAFDIGVSHVNIVELMTPRLSNAYLDPKRAVYASKAHGYNDLPFLPLNKSNGTITWIALHSVQHSWEDPNSKGKQNLSYLIRSMDSHACIRLRMKDLYEMHYIVMQSKRVNVNIRYWLTDMMDSVYPLNNSYYNSVKNYGTVKYPQTRKAPAGYDVIERFDNPPPFERLN